MKIQVTVEMELDNLPDDAARELARDIVEARGLNVSRVAIVKSPDRVKVWQPKRNEPGAPVVVNGRRFAVWSQGPNHKGRCTDLWVVPEDRTEDDAPVYKYNGWDLIAYTGDGKRIPKGVAA